MNDRIRIVDAVERAIDARPTCPDCGAPTTVVETGEALHLRCAATIEPEGLRARLGGRFLTHLDEVILDLEDRPAA